jgi:hypothetical protein
MSRCVVKRRFRSASEVNFPRAKGNVSSHGISELIIDNHNPFSSSEVSIMERLDEFSKLLAKSLSRRESLRRIGAFAAGAVLSPLGLGTAWAARPDRCGAFCRWCHSKAQRNQCLAACRACNGNTSRLCGSCGYYSVCATGKACCNGTCTNLGSDPANCGACGNVCAAGTSCVNGTCSAGDGCFGGQVRCDGVCREIGGDPSHCGACFNQCGPGQNCAGGVCQDAEPPGLLWGVSQTPTRFRVVLESKSGR